MPRKLDYGYARPLPKLIEEIGQEGLDKLVETYKEQPGWLDGPIDLCVYAVKEFDVNLTLLEGSTLLKEVARLAGGEVSDS